MSEKRKLFVVSDIHGHATLLKQALNEAGFDPNNPNHLFVGCGDYFDRGTENRQVLKYLERLTNKVLLKGNHEDILARVIEEGHIDCYDIMNGTYITVSQFFGERNIDAYGVIDIKQSAYREIEKFLEQTVDYFETENYIFVHGWLPVNVEAEPVLYSPDWRKAPKSAWKDARFIGWQEAYPKGLTVKDKTIVCGHRPAMYGYHFDKSRVSSDWTTFYGDGMIAIDGCTVRSGIVNVLVIEDFLL